MSDKKQKYEHDKKQKYTRAKNAAKSWYQKYLETKQELEYVSDKLEMLEKTSVNEKEKLLIKIALLEKEKLLAENKIEHLQEIKQDLQERYNEVKQDLREQQKWYLPKK